MSDLATYLREGRHVFSVCPDCASIARLGDLELERKGRYTPDWLDEITRKIERIAQRTFALNEKARELRTSARLLAERELVPIRLKEIAPAIIRAGIDPREVRALFDPVEFVVFCGMNTEGGVREVQFCSVGGLSGRGRSLQRAIAGKAYDWNLIRVSDDGTLSQSKKYAADSKTRSLSEFSRAPRPISTNAETYGARAN